MNAHLRTSIRTLRDAHGLTQAELADDLGVKQQTIAKWEKGETRPKLPELVALARRFRVSTDQLLGLAPAPTAASVEAAVWADPDLTERQRGALLDAYRLARGRA